MKKRIIFFIAIAAIAFACLSFIYSTIRNIGGDIKSFIVVKTPPSIDPDYTSTVIPLDIAPLNFIIKESGAGFFTDIHGSKGAHITIKSLRPIVQIPLKKWRKLLALNKGGEIHIDIFAKGNDGAWKRFAPITNTVSPDAIDEYLVYRLLPPLYTMYGKMGIYQRRISTFEEKPLWLNRMSGGNCMNCHTFLHNDPDYMILHMRGGEGNGTLIKRGNTMFKVNTATEFNKPAGYPAWHPSGTIVAFSVNTIRQFFHATGDNREGFDKGSKIILYNVSTNTISSTPSLSDPSAMPTQPEWSPDGRYLYYCTAPRIPADGISLCHEKICYDLMRIGFTASTGAWGAPEIVLSHEKTGRSISFPRISPDGNFLLCCMMPFGAFPVFRPGGDIYLLNTQSGNYRRLEMNSDEAESFPRWSSNGRWFVFVSKRIDGISARPYFSHIDSNGVASKPLLLPQKDPRFYESFLKTYNLPELLKAPFSVSPRALVRALCDNKHIRNAQCDPEIITRLGLQKKTTPDTNDRNTSQQSQNKATTH